MTAVWMWNWGAGHRYAIEPREDGGFDTVVETGLQGSLDREQWETLEQAQDRFRDDLVGKADEGVEGAEAALAALDELR
ncbi:MAG TPA: hypothetical protein VGD67_23780 [Pseudonocardiaceae bacterium]